MVAQSVHSSWNPLVSILVLFLFSYFDSKTKKIIWNCSLRHGLCCFFFSIFIHSCHHYHFLLLRLHRTLHLLLVSLALSHFLCRFLPLFLSLSLYDQLFVLRCRAHQTLIFSIPKSHVCGYFVHFYLFILFFFSFFFVIIFFFFTQFFVYSVYRTDIPKPMSVCLHVSQSIFALVSFSIAITSYSVLFYFFFFAYCCVCVFCFVSYGLRFVDCKAVDESKVRIKKKDMHFKTLLLLLFVLLTLMWFVWLFSVFFSVFV